MVGGRSNAKSTGKGNIMTIAFMEYRDEFKYQLYVRKTKDNPNRFLKVQISIYPTEWIHTHFIQLTPDGVLYLKHGYAWNGANVVPDTDSILRASLIHDALYQLIRNGYLGMEHREEADKIFRKICLEDGMWGWYAWTTYQAVRKGGKGSASRDSIRKIRRAPKKVEVFNQSDTDWGESWE